MLSDIPKSDGMVPGCRSDWMRGDCLFSDAIVIENRAGDQGTPPPDVISQ
jgi:hypothetical protein